MVHSFNAYYWLPTVWTLNTFFRGVDPVENKTCKGPALVELTFQWEMVREGPLLLFLTSQTDELFPQFLPGSFSPSSSQIL